MRIAAGLAVAALALPVAAQAPASLTPAAVAAFDAVCLKNAASLAAVRTAATAAPWSFERAGDMPYYGGKTIESYKAPSGLELALRADRNGFGCMVIYTIPDAETADSVAAAMSALPGLTVASPGKGSEYRASWSVAAAPAGSKVYLTVHGKMTPRAPILALESKGALQ